MQNCKQPNNGNNTLERRDGELRLYDTTGNYTKVADWSETESAVASLDGELTAVEATLENCGRELAIDGQNLSLLGADDAVLSTVELPAGGGGGSVHAHAMALYFNATTEEDNYVKAEYAADGIRIKPRTTVSSADLRFEVELTDPTKYVFDPDKPVFWRYLAYNGSYHIYVPMTINEQVYIPPLETPADATSPLLCTQSLDWQTYNTDRVIIEVFAELVPAGGE